ncbi:MAG: putative manganese transporter [Candidatus Thalassarchaeaceae archaeon]|nr:putative manganese transporter [Candidatus Thalassarchaeaceae archaeon]
MAFNITFGEALEILVISMRDAFLAVTVFVAAMVLLFSWLQYITAGRFVEWIRNNERWQPALGAIMGLTPGCGGAIIMMPMYTRGYVTYGTVIATLIATLGDAAFVLIGAVFLNPDFLTPVLIVHVTSFVVGVTWGYGADAIGVTPSRPLGRFGPTFGSKELLGEEAAKQLEGDTGFYVQSEDSVLEDLPREVPEGLGYQIIHQGYRVWWAVTAVGLVLAIMLLFWYAQDAEYAPELAWNPMTRDGLITWVGLIGTSLSIILYLSSKNFLSDDTEATIGDKLHSMDETLVHAASETAFVTFWVLIAYLAFAFGMVAFGMDNGDFAEHGAGVGAVFVAAGIGLIPGCGPQIIAITAYVEGIVSFPALVANAISQDGDALFPLLVRHKTASIWATIHTTLPALLIGLAFLWAMGEYPEIERLLQP